MVNVIHVINDSQDGMSECQSAMYRFKAAVKPLCCCVFMTPFALAFMCFHAAFPKPGQMKESGPWDFVWYSTFPHESKGWMEKGLWKGLCAPKSCHMRILRYSQHKLQQPAVSQPKWLFQQLGISGTWALAVFLSPSHILCSSLDSVESSANSMLIGSNFECTRNLRPENIKEI